MRPRYCPVLRRASLVLRTYINKNIIVMSNGSNNGHGDDHGHGGNYDDHDDDDNHDVSNNDLGRVVE